METSWQDLRFAIRVLRRNPAFTLAAVASLALGIGANTAVFSIVHAVLLRPLPYPDAQRLVRVARQEAPEEVSIADLASWRAHLGSSPFIAMAGYRNIETRSFAAGDAREWIATMGVTPGFFAVLGVTPVLGREFSAGETRSLVITHALWKRLLDSDPRAVGKVVMLEGVAHTIAGVLPQTFWFPQPVEAFVPLWDSGTTQDRGANTSVIARLKPGVGVRQAAGAFGLAVSSFQEWVTGDARGNLLLLFGGVGLLLLIACANVASLVVARLATRQKEIAMRLALGSSRRGLLGQLAVENLLWGAMGTVAGLLLASWMLDGLLAVIPFDLPAAAPIRLSSPMLLLTVAIALGASILFGLAPILHVSRLNLFAALKAGGPRAVGAGRQRTRSLLVTGEVAVSVALLAAAALLIQSLYRMHREQLGFSARGVITFYTLPPAAGGLQQPAAILMDRLRAVPGVQSLAAVNFLPLTDPNNFPAEPAGHPEQNIGGVEIRVITPDYFNALGIPIVRGRPFNDRDTAGAPPVIAVNESLARQWWGPDAALDGSVVVGPGYEFSGHKERPRRVVAVAGDTKTVYLRQRPRPTVYLPAAQTPWYTGGMYWVVKTNGSAGISEPIRRAVAEAVPALRVERWRTMDEIVASTTADSRFDAWVCGIFAGVALLLTATGIYGLLSFSVARRAGEIGTRLALGATRGAVLKLVLRQGASLIAMGLVAGLAGAIVLTRSLRGLLFGVRPADPLSFLAVTVVLVAVGLAASYLPARRATRIDPLSALRSE